MHAQRGDTAGRTLIEVVDTYQLTFYRAGAFASAQTFRSWALSPEGRPRSAPPGVHCSDTGDVVRLDEVVADSLEERASIDARISYRHVADSDDRPAALDATILVNPSWDADAMEFTDPEATVEVEIDG